MSPMSGLSHFAGSFTGVLNWAASVVVPTLLDAAAKGTLILVAVWLGSLLMRHSSAAARHLAWGAGRGRPAAAPRPLGRPASVAGVAAMDGPRHPVGCGGAGAGSAAVPR